MPTYDSIVIGAGQAGVPLAVRLAKSGRKTAIIERHNVGGTCVNVGCIPTKTLVASARVAHMARRAADFGVRIGSDVAVDMSAVKQRMDRIRGESNQSVTRWIEDTSNLMLVRAHARFAAPHAIQVGDDVFEAEQVFLNVGARAAVPDIAGLSEAPYLTNSSILDLDRLPRHLVIIGGSYIGLEFAQMYRRFGSEVSVLEMGASVIPREDANVRAAVATCLESEGVSISTLVKVLKVKPCTGGIEVHFSDSRGVQKIEGSHLLLAVGRTPNTDDLGLEKVGIATDAHGYIKVDDTLCTNVPGVWAMGDVNGRGAFTHTSYNDYEIVAQNLLDGTQRSVNDRITAYALYIDPPLARIGLTVDQVRQSKRPALLGTMMMSRVGRARERSETEGFMQIVVDAQSEHILGATLFGIEADEVIHCILDLMYTKASYKVLERAVHIHPTVSELVPTLVGELKPLAS